MNTHTKATVPADFQGTRCTCGKKFLFGGVLSPNEALREHIVQAQALTAVAAHIKR